MHDLPDLLPVADAKSQILAQFSPLPAEPVPLAAALGRVLAEDVAAPERLPAFDNSGMDGYAVRASDLARASHETPVTLPVAGDVPAGHPFAGEMPPDSAVRIMTGAPVPAGADAVIPVEDTDDVAARAGGALPAAVRCFAALPVGANVRPAGVDIDAGEVALAAGRAITPANLGLLAALGLNAVPVHRRPRVAVLSTGDELVPYDSAPGPGQIRNTNSAVLEAQVQHYGGVVIPLAPAPDTVEAVMARLQAAADAGADLIISSGGVSLGTHDVVRHVLEQLGALRFWRINMRPGKPVAFAQVLGVPLIGLPGNPVSAFTTFEVLVQPVLRKLAGFASDGRHEISVVLGEAFSSDGRATWLRAELRRDPASGALRAWAAGAQGSNLFRPLARANALLLLPEGVRQADAGAVLTAWPLVWPIE